MNRSPFVEFGIYAILIAICDLILGASVREVGEFALRFMGIAACLRAVLDLVRSYWP